MTAFLTARWTNLCLLNYAVPPSALEPHLPRGLSLDTHEGETFISLVAFDFLDTRVLGIPWPGYRNFPEINLRFYARQGDRRGVVFIREWVPQPLVAWLARTLYNEPYLATPMRSSTTETDASITVEHHLLYGGRANTVRVTANKPAVMVSEDSVEHFFKEHQWGFGMSRQGEPTLYEVRHPHWRTFPVEAAELDWDWELIYGPKWAFLQEQAPHSTVLAVGSDISVHPLTKSNDK